jgi:ABC-2 type transport system ATP-binding protein
MPSTPLLQLQRVSRILAGRTVVENVNFQLDRGSVLGLLGVNGAGKSTTLRMIAGILAPSAGSVLLDGADLAEHPERPRQHLGFLPERAPLYPELRVEEYLVFCARLHGLTRAAARTAAAQAIARCGLGEVHRRLLGNLSKGYQQRAGIAAAIVHAPALIVLDEPASGLDPLQSSELRALVRELGREHAVILSTHQLSDVAACCDRVAILHAGRLRYDAPLAPQTGALYLRVERAVDPAAWLALAPVASARADGEGWRVELKPEASAAALSAAVVGAGWGLLELRAEAGDLERTFLGIASASEARAA